MESKETTGRFFPIASLAFSLQGDTAFPNNLAYEH
jgi:hypothetical protein